MLMGQSVSPVMKKGCKSFFLFCTRFSQGSKVFWGLILVFCSYFEDDLRVQVEGLYTTEVINGERLLADLKTEN